MSVSELTELVWLVPALPLAGFALLVVAGRRLGEPAAGWIGTAAVAGSFAASILVFIGMLDRGGEDRIVTHKLFTWIPAGDFSVDIAFLVDPLSVTMILFVTGVSMLIHLYSIGYMHGDADFSKFFVYLNLFVFSMLLLVLGDNMLLTFLGWEGVGACSYLLISFWFGDEANASAGKKAFVTNRVGDFGFMVAMFFAFFTFGSITYGEMFSGDISQTTATAIVVALMLGAAGKSAQFPLYLWLPDAMAGPTPVSALIHAATMVTSGVYLLVRFSPLLEAADSWVPAMIAWIGLGTAAFAATIAIGQNDIKKVLAYSTVSQLGFMFVAIGTGAYVAAVFHMVTHAFFKALMFLGSGSVIHGMDDEQDMRRYGGLAKVMPVTAVTFIVGWLAIAGVPPFSGFWSKDEILVFAYNDNKVLYVLLLATAILTAFYMSRLVFMTFFGERRWADDAHPHESPWQMTLPLAVLAIAALGAGALNLPFTKDVHFLEHWLEPSLFGNEAELAFKGGTKWVLAGVAIVGSTLGIIAGVVVYLQKRIAAARVEPPVFARGWYYDETVSAAMGGPGRAAFQATADADTSVVDGIVNGVAKLVRVGGGWTRRLQTGLVRSYALGITFGVVVLLGWFLARTSF
ncbi:MAG: NADH-quinone oxidoreductase subunit L [Acidimicrobiales bacterium]